MVSNITQFIVHSEKDLSKNKKFPADKLISFLVSEGSLSTKVEFLNSFEMGTMCPTASAFNQQRTKLKPETLETVFKQFYSLVTS